MSNYESFRIGFQDSEQAARAAYDAWFEAHEQAKRLEAAKRAADAQADTHVAGAIALNDEVTRLRADHDDLLSRFGSVCGELDQAQHDLAQERSRCAELNQENDRLEEANTRLHRERNAAITERDAFRADYNKHVSSGMDLERQNSRLIVSAGELRGSLDVQIDANKALTAEVTRLREELADYKPAHRNLAQQSIELLNERAELFKKIDALEHKADTRRMIARPVGDGSGSYLIEPENKQLAHYVSMLRNSSFGAKPEPVSASIHDRIDAVNAAQSECWIHGNYVHQNGRIKREQPKPPTSEALEFTAGKTDLKGDSGAFASGINVGGPGCVPWGNRIECYGSSAGRAQELRDRVLEALCSK